MPFINGEYLPNPPATPTYPPVIVTSSLPNGAVASAYTEALSVVYGTAPYTFAVTAGTLPPGLSLSAAGALTGTPTASGTYTFVVTVTDSAGLTGSSSLTLAIPSVPAIQQLSLPMGTVGIPFYASLTGSGGASPYGFQVTAGALPTGLTLASTGGITGTPTTAGTTSVTIQIYDSGSPQGVATSTFTITIQAASLASSVRAMDAVVLLGCADGGLYAIIPGQRYDTDINGKQVGFRQRWKSVPGPSAKMGELMIGGATVSAKGAGTLNVATFDGSGNRTNLSSQRRPMILSLVETVRDFMAVGVPKSERFGIDFDNGGVVGSWFELHTAILWVRQFWSGRKG